MTVLTYRLLILSPSPSQRPHYIIGPTISHFLSLQLLSHSAYLHHCCYHKAPATLIVHPLVSVIKTVESLGPITLRLPLSRRSHTLRSAWFGCLLLCTALCRRSAHPVKDSFSKAKTALPNHLCESSNWRPAAF